MDRVPPLIVVPPLYVFVPLRVNVLVPVCTKAPGDIPSMISGTNSLVTNLIGKTDIKFSAPSTDEGYKPWVKVIKNTPNLHLRCLGCSINLPTQHGIVKLDNFILENEIQYDSLLSTLIGDSQDAPYVKSILKFLVEQSATGSPGLLTVCFVAALDELCQYKSMPYDLKLLWSKIVDKATTKLCLRKRQLLSPHGLISTAHILTFPSILKNLQETSNGCAKKVNEHYFFYGPKSKSIFNLCFPTDGSSNLVTTDGKLFQDQVYFPELEEDFMLTITCLNSWIKNVDATGRMLSTLGHIYKIYLNETFNYSIESTAEVTNSFALEILVHWCNCFASHKRESLKFLEHFLRNIQSIESQSKNVGIDFKPLIVSESLRRFLDRYEVPYLFPNATQDRPIVQRVYEFMKMGNSYRPASKIGWDVIFEAKMIDDTSLTECFIECKLWSNSVGIPMIFKYYKKSCADMHPISILVARSFQESLESPEILEKRKKLSANERSVEEAEIEAEELSRSSSNKRIKKDYVELLENLWEDPLKHINLYTIKFDESDLSFKCTALKEFEHPIGVFLVVDSNFIPQSLSRTS